MTVKFCPECKNDEAYGYMGSILMCLMCGYTSKGDKKDE